MPNDADIVIVGAGAAGLFAGIFAARSRPDRRVLLLDGAKTLGAKILVAGGGRCNVTHEQVDASAYAGSSAGAINKVLRRFDVSQTIAFFSELGVPLKRENTGKLFPTTNSARTVLNALLHALADAGAEVRHPCRVETITRADNMFIISGDWGSLRAAKVVLATGGRSLPKSGSDGHGYALAQALGHTITPRVFPALVPLVLPGGHFLRDLSGISADVLLEVRAASGKRIAAFEGALLCTHFGISGPAPLDISRYWLDARHNDEKAGLFVNWLPDHTTDSFERALLEGGRASVGRMIGARLPERLARALIGHADIDPATPTDQLTREARKALAQAITNLRLPLAGDRGFTYAEVTAGGVPLRELKLDTLESRICPNLYLCGEICDVDGRIGGYNFQWAWASGYVIGVGL